VRREVLAEFPNSRQHSPMTYPLQVEVDEVRQRQPGTASVQCPAEQRLADDGDHFEIEHLGRRQPLALQPRASALTDRFARKPERHMTALVAPSPIQQVVETRASLLFYQAAQEVLL